MKKVEILVQIKGEWQAVDTYGEVPPMVFQINNLNSLVDRQASYSQSISFPKTAWNNRLFGHLSVFEIRSSAPYDLIPIRVYLDGVEIVGDGFKLVIDTVDDNYKGQIVSSSVGLFGTLSALKFADLGLDPFVWNADTINADNASGASALRKWFQTAAKYAYNKGTIEMRIGGERADNSSPSSTGFGYIAEIFPYYSMVEVARLIFAAQGYALDIDVDTIPGYVPQYFSLSNMVAQADSLNLIDGSFTGPTKSYSGVPSAPIPLLDSIVSYTAQYADLDAVSFVNPRAKSWDENGDGVIDPGEGTTESLIPTVYAVKYSSAGCYRMHLGATVNVNGDPGAARIRFRICKYSDYVSDTEPRVYGIPEHEIVSETEPEGVIVSTLIDSGGWVSESFDLSVGEDVYVEAYLMEGSGSVRFSVTVNIIFEPGENKCGPGSKVYPALCTDFGTQKDFIQLLVQTHGLFITVDEIDKVVYARNFKTLYDNVTSGKFVDWTSKMDMAISSEVKYKMDGYARVNRLLAAEHVQLKVDTSKIAQDIAIFSVDDANLDASKDVITFPFQSGFDVDAAFTGFDITGVSGALSGVTNFDCDNRLYNENRKYFYMTMGLVTANPRRPHRVYKLADAKMHIVEYREYPIANGSTDGKFIYRYSHNTDELQILPRFGSALKMQDVIDTYYAPLYDGILAPTRVLKAEFFLTPLDIAGLDLLKPVYLDQVGDFFYIQKIDNYRAGTMTEVTLICLNVR